MPDPTPQEVIAQALHHIAGEGHTDETALAVADHVIHTLRVAGYKISQVEIPAEVRLLAAVRALVDESGIKQIHIARKLGVSPKHMSALLTGKAPLSISWAEQVVAACGRSLDICISENGDTQ